MAFTEEQEEILKRIIEAFQNGKTINDLPRVPYPIIKSEAEAFPIEIIRDGRSMYIIAGDLNNALNAADKKLVNQNLKDLRAKWDYLDRPQISIELADGIKIHNAKWYESNGYGLYFFRNIKATNNKVDEIQGGHFYDYSRCWKPMGLPGPSGTTQKRDLYIILNTTADGFVAKDGEPITPDDLLYYYTKVATNGKTYLRAKWGHRGKKIDITRTRATLTFECGFAYGPVYETNETETMRISDMTSNFVPFKIVMYFNPPRTDTGYKGEWKIMFAL